VRAPVVSPNTFRPHFHSYFTSISVSGLPPDIIAAVWWTRLLVMVEMVVAQAFAIVVFGIGLNHFRAAPVPLLPGPPGALESVCTCHTLLCIDYHYQRFVMHIHARVCFLLPCRYAPVWAASTPVARPRAARGCNPCDAC
jgi:hypothetical protein